MVKSNHFDQAVNMYKLILFMLHSLAVSALLQGSVSLHSNDKAIFFFPFLSQLDHTLNPFALRKAKIVYKHLKR